MRGSKLGVQFFVWQALFGKHGSDWLFLEEMCPYWALRMWTRRN
jgi:hypothetical protein